MTITCLSCVYCSRRSRTKRSEYHYVCVFNGEKVDASSKPCIGFASKSKPRLPFDLPPRPVLPEELL